MRAAASVFSSRHAIVIGPVPPGIYGVSLLLAGVMLFLLTSFCGWYPSLLATRIPPAEALRYE